MEDLKEIRRNITEIDNRMAELFEARMEQVAKVAEYKKANGLPIFDPEREEQVVVNGASRMKAPELKSHYVNFLKNLMELSKEYQRNILEGLRVAYSGTEGAFAHIAATKIFPDAEIIAYSNFKKAYEAVEKGECDCAVLPVENSYAGDVDQVNDLMFAGNLYVNGMYDLPIIHDLLGLPGATVKDIKSVVSHPQALSQCSSFIKENELEEIEYSNTALAAEYVKSKQDVTVAAVASSESSKLFGLEVIAGSINDDRTNTTRFAVFSRTDNRGAADGRHRYFSLLFTARNEAGSLAQALTIIGKHGFNMRTLRSRPMKELMWQYYFYVEAEGDIYGEEGSRCLEELKACCDKIKIVGSYNTLYSQEG